MDPGQRTQLQNLPTEATIASEDGHQQEVAELLRREAARRDDLSFGEGNSSSPPVVGGQTQATPSSPQTNNGRDQPVTHAALTSIEDHQGTEAGADLAALGPVNACKGNWPQPLGEVVHSGMPRLREEVEEWRRSELELDVEEHRRKDQSRQITRWLETVGLGQYADVLRHGRYCGPQALAQLQALPREELVQFCEVVVETVQCDQTGKGDDLAGGMVSDELAGATLRGKPRCCRARRIAGSTMTGILLLVGVTALGMCSSTTVGCAL